MEYVDPKIYDARGNGGGDISPTITGDHQNRITDYTAIILDSRKRVYDPSRRHSYEDLGDTCITLEGFMGTGGGNIPIVLEQIDESNRHDSGSPDT